MAPLIAVFKLGQKSHLEKLVREGHVYMNTLSYFSALEDRSPRADPDEGTGYCQNGEGAAFRIEQDENWRTVGRVRGPLLFREKEPSAVNVYCLHGWTQNDYGHVFQLRQLGFGDSYVLFLDANEFFRRLENAASEVGQQMEWGIVKYVDRRTYTGPMGVLRKFSAHAAEREVRVHLSPGTGGALSLRLGDLSDIAFMGDASQRVRMDR